MVMSKSMKFNEFKRLLASAGFQPIKGNSKHLKYKHSSGAMFTLPNHPAKDVNKVYIDRAREICNTKR